MAAFQYSLASEKESESLPSSEQALLALSETLLKTGDMKKSLQDILVNGLSPQVKGLADLLTEIKNLKTSILKQYNPQPTLDALQRQLESEEEAFSNVGQSDRKGTSVRPDQIGGARLLDWEKEKEKSKRKSTTSVSDLTAMLGELLDQHTFGGSQSLSPEQAINLIERMHLIAQLERELQRVIWGYDLNTIDSKKVETLLGEDAARALEDLKAITSALKDSGLLEEWQKSHRLTRKGFGIISSKLLKEIFDLMKRDLAGRHVARSSGEGNIDITASRPYTFGLPLHIALSKTLMNAAVRQGRSKPLSLHADDFEVYDPEHTTRCATVLMLDMSKSMKDRNNFLTAKKVALALNDLIRRKFPRDRLEIIGFSTLPRKLLPEELPYILWDADQPYTNIQEGLWLSLRTLRRQGYHNKQIILITDGEPTAPAEGGRLYFQFPPHPRTIELTLEAVKQCAREGITINTFMMVKSNPLTNFVEELTKINQGRAYYADSGQLGKHIIVDYLNIKQQKRG
jgi:uncharacterized protein with von Willebrand factor type A (vWA) domain